MEFSLKNLKILEKASKETICFQADLLINGKVAGLATNEGNGEATTVMLSEKFQFVEGKHYEAPCFCVSGLFLSREDYLDQAGETECKFCRGKKVYEQSIDKIVDKLVSSERERNEAIKAISSFKKKFKYMIVQANRYVAANFVNEEDTYIELADFN